MKNKSVGLHQTKRLCKKKITPSTKLKGNLWSGGKYLQIIPNKELTSKLHKDLIQLNRKKHNKKIGKETEYTSFQRKHTDGQ